MQFTRMLSAITSVAPWVFENIISADFVTL